MKTRPSQSDLEARTAYNLERWGTLPERCQKVYDILLNEARPVVVSELKSLSGMSNGALGPVLLSLRKQGKVRRRSRKTGWEALP